MNSSPTGSEPRLKWRVACARAVLLWESLWRALWPASGIAALFLAAALFGFFLILPGWLHAALLAATLFALALSLATGFLPFMLPNWRDGARRLERDNALDHRPVSESTDTLAAGTGDPLAEALWSQHLARKLSGLATLKLQAPKPALWQRDPKGFRFIAFAALIVAVFVAGQDWSSRLTASLMPRLFGSGALPTLDAWIDPPAYTGQAPTYLSTKHSITAPQGSVVQLRVHNAATRPRLSGPQSDARFTGGKGEYAAKVKLTSSTTLTIRADGLRIGQWHIAVTPDRKPSISFAAKPGKTAQDALKLSFTAKDDYGVVAARAILKPRGEKDKPLSVELPLSAASARQLTETVYRDLTDHPYAGLEVDITLEAKDAAGQTARSNTVRFKLPARLFTNPLARALIEQRQTLARGEDKTQDKVSDALDALTIAPQHFYQSKTGVYLAIRAARWAAKTARRDEDFRRSESLMWQTALAIEQGGLSLAAAELRRLQQAINEALARGAPQDEIETLLQRYREALQRYMRFMAQNARPGSGQLPPNAKLLSQEDLETLLKAIQQLSETGARGQAAQMLAMLQSLLENMQMTAGAGGSGQGQSEQDKALADKIGKLGELMGRQRALLDRTLRAQEGAGDSKDLAGKQRDLRDALKQLEKELGNEKGAGEHLDRAGRAMDQAEKQLRQQELDSASASEKSALENLRSGADRLAKQLMERGGRPGQSGRESQEDPLGRDLGGDGPQFGNSVKLPDRMTLERARSILKELRRRAAERGRPKEELDYIDRLLKEF